MQQTHQLGLFSQKGVMAMIAGHFAVVGLGARGSDGFGESPHIFGRKEPVRADTDKAELSADTAECLLRRGVPEQRIPCIHGAQNRQVGVGVKALNESIALKIKVAGDVKALADKAAAMAVCCPRDLRRCG